MTSLIYAAYGSNMCPAQMAVRCPGAVLIGHHELPGWRLTFRGYSPRRRGAVASIEQLPAGQRGAVALALWRVTPEHIEALDGYEGHPTVYKRREITIPSVQGELVAVTYIHQARRSGAPSFAYCAIIARGYSYGGFDSDKVYHAAERCERIQKKRIDSEIERMSAPKTKQKPVALPAPAAGVRKRRKARKSFDFKSLDDLDSIPF
jgi:gamma-glutamylcyclotransferase (GGCT)/AIG2-like uncharacterized protein YtfP